MMTLLHDLNLMYATSYMKPITLNTSLNVFQSDTNKIKTRLVIKAKFNILKLIDKFDWLIPYIKKWSAQKIRAR